MIKTFEEFNRSSKPRLNEGRHYGMTLHTAERYEKNILKELYVVRMG